ncbi:MAG: Hsp20 family protein [Geminicoccaceae bacterium]|jgi:molecular chaperone IbpA
MRSFDLTPLFRHSVGFDRLDELFETAFRNAAQENSYPPYNIVKTGDDTYRITLAVAGFGEDDLEIVSKENLLTVRGKGAEADKEIAYLHRGIAKRAFEHRFQLADYVRVSGADLNNGVLDIDLVRELPERMKPVQIAIGGGSKAKVIEDKKTKAAA